MSRPNEPQVVSAKAGPAARKNIEDIFPLSPMQQGMMFHTLNDPDSGVYVVQIRLTLEPLDAALFRRAWSQAVERFTAMRTAIVGTGRKEPVQVVRRQVEPSWTEHDCSRLDADEQAAWIASFLEADHRQGFRLDEPSLIRLTLVRLGERRYELIWTVHHIVLDGWSGSNVLADVFKIYHALRRGETPALPPVRPFREYIGWLRSQDADAAETYWRGQLDGFAVPTMIPADHPERVSRDVASYDDASLTLSESLTTSVRQAAAANRITINTLLQGAWALLLARATNEENVVFGTVVSGRPDELEDVGNMVGMFVNTLPLRVHVDGEAPAKRWLADLQASQVERQRHEHAPLWEIQQWSEVPTGTPLFESLYVFENYASASRSLSHASDDGLRISSTPPFDRTGFPLMLLIIPGTAMKLRITYDPTRFEASTIDRILRQLAQLLAQLAETDDRPLADLEMLDAAERDRILVDWNQTAQAFPTDRCLHHLVEAQVDANPDAPAVAAGAMQLTYRELDERANQLAHHLRTLGVGPDVPVGVCVQRSFDMVVAVLGVLKAGGASVPLDPGYPPERLAYMLHNAKAPVVITHAAAVDGLPALDEMAEAPAIVDLDRDADAIAQLPTTRPDVDVTPANLLYVLYTSGSTGRPKGVAMPHAPLANLIHWQFDQSELATGDRTLQFAPLSFDVAHQELFATLGAGGTLVLIDEDTRRDPEALLELLDAQAVARIFVPFVALQQLAEVAVRADRMPVSLREVVTAGEQLQVTPALVEMFERLDGATLVNQYGPTECHVVSSYTLTGPPATWPALPPIGRPIANTRLYLLDRQMRPVPVGTPGELYVGGAAVARGYLHDEAQTAARFIDDPFDDAPGARLYRTGDLGRFLETGDIEFLGRADDQVKVRGFRVELGEVETVVLEHPAVRQAAVIVREDRPRDKRLVAYVVTGDETPDAAGLRAHAAERLPEYMVPSGFVRVPALPTTPSGKIDRRALLAEKYAPLELRASYVAPRDGTEEILASIWADVLGAPSPGVHDDFFELGGHSLMVTQLVSRIRDALKTEVALRTVFEHPTIASLAAAIARGTAESERPPLVPTPRDVEPPLSFAQQRLWFLDQLGSGAAYNMPWAYRIDGDLDVSALERAIGSVVERHEALRTCFPAVDGKPVQRVLPTMHVPSPVVDLSDGDGDAASREAEAQRLYREEAVRPFDLATGPLLRVTVVRLDDRAHLLFLSIHHIVFDGWSIGILNRELLALYGAFVAGETATLPPLPVQYADFSTWQESWLTGDVFDAQLAYWRGKLANMRQLDLPIDKTRPAVQTYRGDAVRFVLDPDLARAVRTLGQRQGVTVAMTMLAAFKALLARWSGHDDVMVGSPIANRTRSEVEGLIGFFVNSLVLRTELDGDPTFKEILQREQQTALEAYENQDLPFERLVDELQPQRDQSRNPLFQVVFALQNASRDPLALPGVEIRPYEGGTVATRFDLELHLQDRGDGLGGGFCYNADLFEHDTIVRLAERLRMLLEHVVAQPDTRLSQMSILPESERQQLLETWNDTSATYPVPGCLHEMFERQVERSPDRVALTCEGEQLTYAELNRKANQVAHRLRALGVGPDHLVGLSLDRGLDLVVGILGVLKAGGGYVPLDLANPRERIAFILEDSKVRVLLTQSSQLDKLPDHDAAVLCLDTDTAAIASESDHDPASGVHTDNVAYVIYTSGSTGTPKGVLVEHGTVARLFTATEHWYGFDADDVWTLFHSFAFDFSVWEMWGALLYGGRLVVVPYWISRSPEDFYKLLDRERVTVLNQTPSAFRQLIATDAEHGADRTLALRYVIFGGEALELQSLRPWFDRHGDERPQLVNMYGITETTVHVTYWPITRRDLDEAPGSVIGRPIPDLQIYILDEHRQLVPIGVPGEMYVGGAGVTRGYLDRPELTAERFVLDPFRAEADARLYRTGDVARYLPDGDLEYLGRNDEQVKVRGFRIELGEIETSLNSHPWVRESVVMVRDDDANGNRRLIGYLVPDQEGASEEADALVGQWQSLYDSTYGRQADEADPTFNIIGWNSSYTGEPIPPAEMRDWVTETVERIRRGNPKRVLEIGCGTGLLLFRLVPHCEAYRGLDFSPVALDHIRGHLDCLGDAASRVDLLCRSADDLEGIEREAYDVVVINSVIQYFPSIHYLLDVLTAAVERTAPGGRVYVGDVRNLRLLEAYHASVQLHQAPEDQSVDDLRHHVRQRLVQEEELVVDPAFFIALAQHLPRVTDVRIEPKRGPAQNELTKFRYEATLIVDGDVGAADGTWLDWTSDDVTLDALRRRLDEGPGVTLGVRGVPNARTAMDLAAADVLLHGTRNGTVGELRETLARDVNGAGFDPSDLLTLGDAGAHAPAVGWSNRSEGGAFDVLYTPRDDDDRAAPFATPRLEPRPWSHYANHPLQAKMTRQLAPRLRESLERTLPGYMIPSAFVMLESLPLTANGKVDRRALPEPEWYLSQRRGAFIAPRTPTESTLADVWSELLGIEDVGVEDDFFDLGGHSLLATQVVSRAREAFGVGLEVRQLFDTPTIATLAEALDALAWAAEGRGAASDDDDDEREGGVL